jgi:hypothetical protein
MVTTSGQNTFDQVVTVRKCSEPNENLKKILDILKVNHRPFKKNKIHSAQTAVTKSNSS